MKKIFVILFFLISFYFSAFSQKAQFSLATDGSVLHSFKKDQRFWCVGQTVAVHFNFTPEDGLYVWFFYTSNGKFSNQLTAGAKSIFTVPLQISYTNNAILRFSHISTGWKHYLKGAYNTEKTWNVYGLAGFGLMFGTAENNHSTSIDTANYVVPVWKGKAHFKRMTFDLGVGYEFLVGGDIYFYMEGRALIPATDYPSNYLFINNNAPLNGSFHAGIRLLF